jgi:UDP-glucose 4-epimerase
MEALRDAGVRRVVFTSSGAVYGEQEVAQVHEDLLPAPTSPYAVSKLAAEGYIRTIGGVWGIETVSLRIFNAYGDGQLVPPTHPPVIPQFVRQIVGDGSLIIHDSGGQIRDYVYVDDVIRALVAAATAPNIDRQIINIGTGVGTSIRDLVKIIEQVTGHKAKIIANPSISGGVSTLVADLSRAKQLLDYEPQVTLAEGLARLTEQNSQLVG